MEIVLQNNLILIRTGFSTLQEAWMTGFLSKHAQDMLFLPKAVLVFNNDMLLEERESFLHALSERYAQEHELSEKFFIRSMLRYARQPIKIELDTLEEPESVTVELYAHNAETVVASLYAPNQWVISFLRSQLDLYVRETSDTSIVLDVSEMRAKSRLERALNKRHILHFHIQYRYDARFMQRLYGDFAGFDFEDEEHEDERIDEMMHYYTVLECPVGASQDALKRSYKKLVKVYHPDRVYCENTDMVNHYTQKFQLLQEAYTALRIVS